MFRTKQMALSACFALGVACGSSEDGDGTSDSVADQFTLVRSDLPRETAPEVSADERQELVDGNTALAVDLYARLSAEAGNLFFSPYSISSALAMTYAGARDQTETEMAQALHFTLPQQRLHPALNALALELESRAETPAEQEAEPFQLSIANSIWGQQDFHFESDFLDTLAINYGAGLRLLDFIEDPQGARETINAWVSRETEEKIPELLAEGILTPLTRLVLTNAIYFKASWQNQFEPDATSAGSFMADGTTEVTVDMMHQAELMPYAAGEGFTAVALPYAGGQLSMLLLVPDAGQFAEFESALSTEVIAGAVEGLLSTNVALALPKFEFESAFSLSAALSELGMPTAFTDAADFSGMTGRADLFISDVVHQAYVGVDETGTEAAAATAVVMTLSGLPPDPVELIVDRPFIFLIRDEPTGAILFLGRVTDPS
jgi:serpin B